MRFAIARQASTSNHVDQLGQVVGRLATKALLRELELTPKPGLVDRENSGAHRDMNFSTFQASAAAIAPWFPYFFELGSDFCDVDAKSFLVRIRESGMACERDMLAATGGINTHKGSIFSLGLLCAAVGRLAGRHEAIECEHVCYEVASICDGLVQKDFVRNTAARTAGERSFLQHGLTGARGEAQSGFLTARVHGVTPYVQALLDGASDEQALLEVLVHLMAHNQDTNLVSRGGMEGLLFVQQQARQLLLNVCPPLPIRKTQLAALDRTLIERNLSPGGSADLLAVSWFLANLDVHLIATGS
jgi:triphosphoribosyl-dephospho-CoA synthase